MSETTTNFYPKGGRCSACRKRLDDCSGLPFEQMPIHRRDGCDAVVICTDFEPATSSSSAPTPPASEQQRAISDEEAVRILLSGGTLVFRVPHPVKGEGV
ncbi:hypothetical protein [Metapseudomonas otitidis]|uniref:hypothetical protein n=1 Tax=Metapseudomonas otitidis TaxID=319939 RepID=UPI001F2C6B55|nr:hypothetical protein [Pseudomonas otitidis]